MGSYSPDLSFRPTVLTVPGLGGSGPAHWQTLWEQSRVDTARVDLGMWSMPHRNAWATKLDQSISQARAPVILVGHSLGCLAIAWWAALSPQPYGWPVAGALLVAPADCGRGRGLPLVDGGQGTGTGPGLGACVDPTNGIAVAASA